MNGEIFLMNTKTIIEFGFGRIWKILLISEGVIHLGNNTLFDRLEFFDILLSLIQ